MKVHNVNWYSHRAFNPINCWTIGSSTGGTDWKLHTVSVCEWTNQFTDIPIQMLIITSLYVIASAVPFHWLQSQNASGSYSHKIGRFAASEVAPLYFDAILKTGWVNAYLCKEINIIVDKWQDFESSLLTFSHFVEFFTSTWLPCWVGWSALFYYYRE